MPLPSYPSPNVAGSVSSGNFSADLAAFNSGMSSIGTSLNGVSIPGLSSIPNLPNLPNIPGLPTAGSVTSAIPASTNGLSGVMDAAKGIAGSAFSAIAGSFKPLQAGVPQDLTAINLKNAADQLAADTKTAAAPVVSSINSSLSAAGVDVTTGRIPAVDAAFASGGIGAGIQAFTGFIGTSGLLNTSSIASGISNLPGGQNAIASVTNSTTGSLSSVTSSLAGIGAIANNLSAGALNGISSASAALSSKASLLTGSDLTGAGSSLSGALSNPSAALASIGSSIGGVVSSVGSSISGFLSGAESSLSGSALSNPTFSLDGLSGIGSSINGAVASAGASITGALSSVGSLNASGAPSLDSLTQGLQSGKQGLASLASAGLSASSAAALTASINSLSTSSPFPIKMPTVAEATVERGEINSQVTKLLGNPIIPPPYNSYSDDLVNQQNTASAKHDQKVKIYFIYLDLKEAYNKEYEIRFAAVDAEFNAYVELKKTLPQGDPQLVRAKELGLQHTKEFGAWAKGELAKIEDARLSIPGVL